MLGLNVINYIIVLTLVEQSLGNPQETETYKDPPSLIIHEVNKYVATSTPLAEMDYESLPFLHKTGFAIHDENEESMFYSK